MRDTILLLLLIISMGCSRPMANFMVGDDLVAPSAVKFTNRSENAETYEWFVDGTLVDETTDLEYRFLNSGRHKVALKAYKGKKKNIFRKDVIVQAPSSCTVLMQTDLGDMIFSLSDLTPGHQKNFLELVESGYYRGIVFHRVMGGFMIQAGDDNMREDKSKTFAHKAEIKKEFNPELVHIRGALAAARMPDDINPDKNSSGTQFYIVHGRDLSERDIDNYASSNLIDYSLGQKEMYRLKGGTPQLDGEYTVFGNMISGEETLARIAAVATDERDKPLENIRIIDIKIIN